MSQATLVRPKSSAAFHRIAVAGGGGRQGKAIVLGLDRLAQKRGRTDVEIAVIEPSLDQAQRAIGDLRDRLGVRTSLVPIASNSATVRNFTHAFRGSDAVVSALPHAMNWRATEAALRARASYTDLGMDNELTAYQHSDEVSARAAKHHRAIVPDNGLAPGLVNIAASFALRETQDPKHVRIFCGGIPERPKPPLHYFSTWSIDGLLDEYMLPCIVLRGGQVTQVNALSEPEWIETPRLAHDRSETDHTSGGSSTSPRYYQSIGVESMEYRTLRPPGHFDFFRQYATRIRRSPHMWLSLADGSRIRARDLKDHLTPKGFPRDVVFFRTVAWNEAGRGVQYELLAKADPKTQLTAMMRTTGFTAAIITYLMASGELGEGSVALDRVAYENARFGREFRAALYHSGLRMFGSAYEKAPPTLSPVEPPPRPPRLDTVG